MAGRVTKAQTAWQSSAIASLRFSRLLFAVLLFVLLGNPTPDLVFADEINTQTEADLTDTANVMTWPLLPGENVQRIAALFYPKNKAMQQKFIAKSIALSQEAHPNLKPDQEFNQITTILIPDLKSLKSASTSSKKPKSSNFPPLHLSYGIADADKIMLTEKMQQDFADLTKRNAELKEKLENINARLAKLQETLKEMLVQANKMMLAKPKVQVAPPIPQEIVTAVVDPNKPKKIRKAEMASQVDAGAIKPSVAPSPAPLTVAPQAINDQPTPVAPTNQPAPVAEVTQADNHPQKKSLGNLGLVKRSHVKVPEYFDENIIEIILELIAIALGLFLAIYTWIWLRKTIKAKFKSITDEKLAQLHKNKYAQNDPSKFRYVKIADAVDNSVLSVEEFDSAVEEAKIFMSMGRKEQAISALTQHIQEEPKTSLAPWMYLLEVYRDLDMHDAFIELGQRFHKTFNVMAPLWHSDTQAGMVISEDLEDFSHIITQLQTLWETPKVRDYLESLIADNRRGERTGFSLEVMKEILLLLAIVEYRDKPLAF